MARYDLDAVKGRAMGHWPSIIYRVGGISDDFLSPRHGPCPKCGGNDRWRVFQDFSEIGGAVCNQCGKFGDGIAVVQWSLSCSFPAALQKIAEFLGVSPSAKSKDGQSTKDPSADLEELPWNDAIVALWCLKKKPITPAAIKTVGGRLARYRNRYTVIAIPIRGQQAGSIVGWTLYEALGGKLPVFRGKGQSPEMLKVKVATGSKSGWMHAEVEAS